MGYAEEKQKKPNNMKKVLAQWKISGDRRIF